MSQIEANRASPGPQTQAVLHGQSQYQSEGNEQQANLIRELRDKTEKVEALSLKMDELYQVNTSLEGLISKIHRYNQQLYTASSAKLTGGEMSQAELRKEIGALNRLLEQYPRQNKNCIEYFEKYKLKYEELDSKFTQQEKTEEQITELLYSLKEKKAKSIEENFKLLSKNFSAIFQSIVKDGSAQLRLVKQVQPDPSQQSDPSQFPAGTQGP